MDSCYFFPSKMSTNYVLVVGSGLAAMILTYFHFSYGLVFLLLPFAVKLIPDVLPKSVHRWFHRDFRAARGALMVAVYTLLRTKLNHSASELFEITARKYSNKTMIIYEGTEWTFEQIDRYANQVAHYFLSVEKLQPGDCVALVATSCPQYPAIWLGLNKIGCITALINCYLKEQPLKHAIHTAQSKFVIIGAELVNNYLPIMNDLTNVYKAVIFNEGRPQPATGTGSLASFDEGIAEMSEEKPIVEKRPGYFDTIYYIYTSGTTGLPKPCIVSSHRLYVYALLHHCIMQLKSTDIFYCALPLYHSAGGAISLGQALFFGSTVVLRKTFSASKFWDEVLTYRCTAFQYVGELCRYLLAQPHFPKEQQHSLRVVFGVGLRPQIWTEFVERFNIPRVIEAYGSTEGNAGLVNIDGKPGAIGFLSKLIELLRKQYLIRVNRDSGEAVRNEEGFCIQCQAGEAGELVGQITQGAFGQFEGYLEKEATTKKHLQNVFQRGDLFFRSGDIMVKDEEGYVYFVDRTGDTFRWKGENVSTTEVEGIISRAIENVDVAVIGVTVPGCEGKAGMACIAHNDTEAIISKLTEHVKENLTTFARPLFLRFLKEIEMTETFRLKKVALRDAGYDLNKVGSDSLFYWNPSSNKYERLLPEHLEKILNGTIRY